MNYNKLEILFKKIINYQINVVVDVNVANSPFSISFRQLSG